jgi:hypothetical protein
VSTSAAAGVASTDRSSNEAKKLVAVVHSRTLLCSDCFIWNKQSTHLSKVVDADIDSAVFVRTAILRCDDFVGRVWVELPSICRNICCRRSRKQEIKNFETR